MCGIVGYIGCKQAYPILLKGLKRLEYRGYDSSGIALIDSDTKIFKKQGKVAELEKFASNANTEGTIGMGHTRWATHGEPNDLNAHPHTSQKGKFVLIHNGIIENYSKLRTRLESEGYVFKSETDTEVLVNLIEYIYLKGDISAEMAVRIALSRVIGAYGLVIACTDEPGQLIAARKSSPIVIGVGENEYYIASDATPIIEYTQSVIYLNNDDVAILTKDSITLKNVKNEALIPKIQKL
ncbi:MAG: glutamine--fructose-6-phosphate aminotransferase, partial [Bacteroidales bacterium]|nr:glutamine--fructose-6-phosphate aminotransferase [Bacteroidales bacterium]